MDLAFFFVFAEISSCLSLLPGGLAVFHKFVVVVADGIGTTVEGLLIEQLGFEQVGHLAGAC